MRRIVPIALLVLATAGLSTAVILTRSPKAADASPRSVARPTACQDQDGDGFGLGCARGPDCNDFDSTVHPGQVETCNFRDDDCNTIVDDSPSCQAAPLDLNPVRVPAGAFTMGSPQAQGAADEHPEHSVQVGAFRIDRYEITNRRYQQCVHRSACDLPGMLSSHLRSDYFENPRYADYPVVFVTWKQADGFCQWAGGRLPTESEWEKTAKGTQPRTFPWGNEAPDCRRANLGGAGSCVGDTDRVGRRIDGMSPYGAMDMAGNVWEWVSDWYDPAYYASAPARDMAGPGSGTLKVMRGGCWESGADSLRVSCRKAELPLTWAYNVGFRCAYPEGR